MNSFFSTICLEKPGEAKKPWSGKMMTGRAGELRASAREMTRRKAPLDIAGLRGKNWLTAGEDPAAVRTLHSGG